MVQYGKMMTTTTNRPNITYPGGGNIPYQSSTTVRMTNIPPITRVLKNLNEPSFFQRLFFRMFGVKECSHYFIIERGSNSTLLKPLKENGVEYHIFGIDQTTYICFDSSAVNHMRFIQ